MNLPDIYTELEECGSEQNKKAYLSNGAKGDLFGVSVADFKRLKGKIISPEGVKGINHSLAQQLWSTRNLDARIFACIIADPAKITSHEANKWVSVIQYYTLADYFTELIVKSRFGIDIMYLWIQSPQEYIKRVGFSILNSFANNDSSKSELFFSAFIQKIKQEIQTSPNRAKEAMFNCLISIGGRTKPLKEKILNTSQDVGIIELNLGKNAMQTYHIENSIKKIWDQKES